MAENWSNNQTTQATEARAQAVDEGLRIYMTKVYNYMGLGLLATALTAYIGAASGIYVALAQTPLIWLVVFAPLGMVLLFISAPASHERARAKTTFWIYAAMTGLSLSYVLLAFTGVSVVRTFLITAASFGALSLYGYTTKARFERHGLVPVYGAYRHYFGVHRQFLHAKPGHAFRHFGHWCADFCRTDGL